MQDTATGPAPQAVALRHYLIATLISAFSLGALAVALGWMLASTTLIATGIALVVCAALITPTIVMVGRGWVQRAALCSAINTLLLGVAVALIAPTALAACVLAIFSAPLVALPYLRSRALLGLSIVTVACVIIACTTGRFLALFPPLPEPATSVLMIIACAALTGLAILLVWQFHRRLEGTVAGLSGANAALHEAQADLAGQVTARTAELRQALDEARERGDVHVRLLAEIELQRTTIRELSVPVLPVNAETLVVPLVGALDGARLEDLQLQALTALERTHARQLLLDITGVPVVDTYVAQALIGVVEAARLLGARCALVGIRPEVAQTIVGLGLDLRGTASFTDLQTALAHFAAAERAARR